jgi:hypothetical protein
MDSPAEILEIRRQWCILKPGDRTHPKNKEYVPDYPEEDSIENVKLRDDGQYRCLHEIAGHMTDAPCCREGLNEREKRNSIQKSLRKQRAKTEKKILQNILHPAHKCWNGWSSETVENSTAQDRARIDSILAPVQNVQHGAPAPTQQVAATEPVQPRKLLLLSICSNNSVLSSLDSHQLLPSRASNSSRINKPATFARVRVSLVQLVRRVSMADQELCHKPNSLLNSSRSRKQPTTASAASTGSSTCGSPGSETSAND